MHFYENERPLFMKGTYEAWPGTTSRTLPGGVGACLSDPLCGH